jgi:hypothetical protein
MSLVGLHETVDQGRRRLERETKLRRKIDAWMAVQQLFIPEVVLLRDAEDAARKRVAATQPVPGVRAQDMKLWMPSAIGRRVRCDEQLLDYEYRLRKGQAEGALEEMCNLLMRQTHEYHYRDRVHGVKAKTRSGTRTAGIKARIDAAADEYRVACAALVQLGAVLGRDKWQGRLKVLAASDVRGKPSTVFGDDERRKRKGKKRKKQRLDPEEEARRTEQAETRALDKKGMSWIWVMDGTAGADVDVVHNEGMSK